MDTGNNSTLDTDLDNKSPEWLIHEIKKLRAGIREHRDNSGHELCWHHPKLWGLMPEQTLPDVAVPPWPQFMRGCIKYRESLEKELPNAIVDSREAP
ncbi:hypothetical protein [Dyadobacter sp. NIV53]|uniref:hypothetical protein n=1 Tax=Dyadobacter sp. NIV53 TaxID=2861765 RepID=UPI001C8781D3|nr:hypothetical protein [Dyadobacter sp. NIV53]